MTMTNRIVGALVTMAALSMPSLAGDAVVWEPEVLLGRRAYLGVELLTLTPKLREHFGAGKDAGVLVADVESDSPAAKAGIQVGDVLVSVDGKPVDSTWGAARALRGHHDGDEVSVELVRDRRRTTVTAKVAEREPRVVDLGDAAVWGHLAGDLRGRELSDALGKAHEYFQGPEWKDRLRKLQGLEKDIEQRTRDLERRLEELERRLSKDGK